MTLHVEMFHKVYMNFFVLYGKYLQLLRSLL